MWTQEVDLHSHSTHSDGVESVEVMAMRAAANGVKVWSLTDHDTAAGWGEAIIHAKKLGLRFIPGVEITCQIGLEPDVVKLECENRVRPSSWHLLAYFPNGCESDFVQWLEEQRDARVPRMQNMLDKLSVYGHQIQLHEVESIAEGSLGRPHLARLMVEKGIVDNFQQAFDDWIGDAGPAFSPRPLPTIQDVVRRVKEAGGLTSLAHPVYYGVELPEILKYSIENGIDAVEAFHRSHLDSVRLELMSGDLPVTVGSDSHGTEYNPSPGGVSVPLTHLHQAFHP